MNSRKLNSIENKDQSLDVKVKTSGIRKFATALAATMAVVSTDINDAYAVPSDIGENWNGCSTASSIDDLTGTTNINSLGYILGLKGKVGSTDEEIIVTTWDQVNDGTNFWSSIDGGVTFIDVTSDFENSHTGSTTGYSYISGGNSFNEFSLSLDSDKNGEIDGNYKVDSSYTFYELDKGGYFGSAKENGNVNVSDWYSPNGSTDVWEATPNGTSTHVLSAPGHSIIAPIGDDENLRTFAVTNGNFVGMASVDSNGVVTQIKPGTDVTVEYMDATDFAPTGYNWPNGEPKDTIFYLSYNQFTQTQTIEFCYDLNSTNSVDMDGDGFYTNPANANETDCDDTNASIYPGAADTHTDGVDANCAPDVPELQDVMVNDEVITDGAVFYGEVGTKFKLGGSARDVDGNSGLTLRYYISGLQGGASMAPYEVSADANGGSVEITLPDVAGTLDVTVRAFDPDGNISQNTQSFSIEVGASVNDLVDGGELPTLIVDGDRVMESDGTNNFIEDDTIYLTDSVTELVGDWSEYNFAMLADDGTETGFINVEGQGAIMIAGDSAWGSNFAPPNAEIINETDTEDQTKWLTVLATAPINVEYWGTHLNSLDGSLELDGAVDLAEGDKLHVADYVDADETEEEETPEPDTGVEPEPDSDPTKDTGKTVDPENPDGEGCSQTGGEGVGGGGFMLALMAFGTAVTRRFGFGKKK